MDARAFIAQSFHSFPAEPRPEYTGPKVGDQATVDRWIDGRWVEVLLVWTGSGYEVGK